jgi:hypothetical protein
VEVEPEDLPSEGVSSSRQVAPSAAALDHLGVRRAENLTPGSAFVVVSVETPRDTATNKDRIAFHLQMLQRAWPGIEKSLAGVDVFKGHQIHVAWDQEAGIASLRSMLQKARDSKSQYVLLVSCREDISVPRSAFHQALKSTTLNVYDVLPLFRYVLGGYHVNYSSIWEGALIDVSREIAVAQTGSVTTVRAYSRGDDLLLEGEEDFKQRAVERAGQLFVQRLAQLSRPPAPAKK